MVPWRATAEGFVTDDVVDWYERLALGRPGALVVEATGVRDIPSGPLLRIGHDRFLPGLARSRRSGATSQWRSLASLHPGHRFSEHSEATRSRKYFERYLVTTDRHRELVGIRDDVALRRRLQELPRSELEQVLSPRELEALDYGYRERVTDLDLPHVRELPQVLPDLFASAAARAEQAGFDGVELHYAHAYTMASFLSRTNTRDDGYGTTLEGRLRLPLEVYRAVRSRVSERCAVGCRFLADECVEGGNDTEEACRIGVAFAKAGMNFLSLSRGGKFDDAKQPSIGWAAYPYTGKSGWECMPTTLADPQGPFGRNVEAARRIRTAVRAAGCSTPVVVSGAIATFDQAEEILKSGAADIVAAARQTLADPDWFRKLSLGRGEEIRRCVFTNYCEGLDQKHKQVTCKLWDREGLDEPGVKLASIGRRRLSAPKWEP